MLAFCLSTLLVSATLASPASYTTPHLAHGMQAIEVQQSGATYTNHGLVGSGRLRADAVDFLGDTLGSFSSLAIDKASWRRVGDHYEALMWTLPDRGRNDPALGLFYDYAARLHRFRIRFKPYQGKSLAASTRSQSQLTILPDGGITLTDFRGQPFTGADPGTGTLMQEGVVLPSPATGTGAGKISMDAESLQFTADGSFYVGDEYAAYVYFFNSKGQLRGVIAPPAAVVPRTNDKIDFNSLAAPDSGRRNNQGVEGMSLSPDGTRLFVMLQSALLQDTAQPGAGRDDASGRVNTRVMVYDVSQEATPAHPMAHYVVQLPSYRSNGNGKASDRTAAQSEIRALNQHQFLMLARDGNGLGTDNTKPIVTKSVLLVDTDGATNLAGTAYETTTRSVLESPDGVALQPGITPAAWVELLNMLNPEQLARFGLNLSTQPKNQPLTLAEKWEAMDLVPALDGAHPDDYFLFIGNDNDFIARHCVMQKQRCDSAFDNDSLVLVYRLTLPGLRQRASP